jgi:hypothetical protein
MGYDLLARAAAAGCRRVKVQTDPDAKAQTVRFIRNMI